MYVSKILLHGVGYVVTVFGSFFYISAWIDVRVVCIYCNIMYAVVNRNVRYLPISISRPLLSLRLRLIHT